MTLSKIVEKETMQEQVLTLSRDKLKAIYRPVRILPLGLDGLPLSLVDSRIFTGHELQQFARLEFIPSIADVEKCAIRYHLTKGRPKRYYHQRAQQLLNKNKVEDAIKVALYEGC